MLTAAEVLLPHTATQWDYTRIKLEEPLPKAGAGGADVAKSHASGAVLGQFGDVERQASRGGCLLALYSRAGLYGGRLCTRPRQFPGPPTALHL